jgi:hypothetical protein
MPGHMTPSLLAALLSVGTLVANAASAHAEGAPSTLPGVPQPSPNLPEGPRLPQSLHGGSGNYAVSAAANEHGAFLWVVDNIQHAVVLCEKSDARDFTCSKKPLP